MQSLAPHGPLFGPIVGSAWTSTVSPQNLRMTSPPHCRCRALHTGTRMRWWHPTRYRVPSPPCPPSQRSSSQPDPVPLGASIRRFCGDFSPQSGQLYTSSGDFADFHLLSWRRLVRGYTVIRASGDAGFHCNAPAGESRRPPSLVRLVYAIPPRADRHTAHGHEGEAKRTHRASVHAHVGV